MNGAESLVATLVKAGVDVCFTNPGTSEMHFVAALDTNPDMRAVLGLFEGVVTGAADGYARMADRPACTLLHLGPGLANGLANLHNARRARTPIVNIVGEHATYHRELDAPLTSDIAGFAGPVSGWIDTCMDAAGVAGSAARAVQAARQPPGQIATLILPADTAWNDAPGAAEPLPVAGRTAVEGARIDAAATALRRGGRVGMLMNGAAMRADCTDIAGRIAVATGAELYGDTFIGRVERGAGRVEVPRLPYFAEQAAEILGGLDALILIGTSAPVSFFAYPGKPSRLWPDRCELLTLAAPGDDITAALTGLAEAVGAVDARPPLQASERPALPRGALTPEAVAQTVSHCLPEGAIVSNEAATAGFAIPAMTAGCPQHDWLDLTGGAIGQGTPVATGAAVACPDRKVVSLQADGSAMYTLQSLWTQAREGLDVTTVIFSNRKYAILQVEFMRVGANPGPKALSMLDLSNPDLDWVHLAQGMGVSATRATTAEEFNRQLPTALADPGPTLIEAVIQQ